MWIEISKSWEISGTDWVTTHTGGVDWNSEFFKNIVNVVYVTTHTGGVDWNSASKSTRYSHERSPPTRVVWIEIKKKSKIPAKKLSPPTRVVWIEIPSRKGIWLSEMVTTHTGGVDWNNSKSKSLSYKPKVTTHTGGVDWNVCGFLLLCWVTLSPPTRVVWIEMQMLTQS